MNFSAVAVDSMVGRLLRLPLRLLPRNMVVPILQGELRGRRWIVGSGVHGYWLGSYEMEKQRRFVQSMKPGYVVYDIGAHVGYYSLMASQRVGPTGRVYAFEPDARNLSYLQKHIEMNKRTNIDVWPGAVSDRTGMKSFVKGTNSFTGRLAPGQSGPHVPIYMLDELVLRQEIMPPHVVKIDVEGEEYRVLLGASHMLQQYRPLIFLATHGSEAHEACVSHLHSRGYSTHNLCTSYSGELCPELLAVPE